MPRDYVKDPAEIYRQSFATIRAEAELSRFPDDVARVVVRLIHTCGQVDVAEHVSYSDDVVVRAVPGDPALSSIVIRHAARVRTSISTHWPDPRP